MFKRLVPSTVTFVGLILGLWGASIWPTRWGCVLLGASLVTDALDGWLARRLDAATKLGGALDFASDVTIACYLATRVVAIPFLLPTLAVLTANQAAAMGLPGWPRCSGRAAVTMLAVALALPL